MTPSHLPLSFKVEKSLSPISDKKRAEILKNPGFGKFFTDHMVTIQWNEQNGWHNATVSQHKHLAISPASAVLHYAQGIFEGLKAYRTKDKRVVLFRPEANAQRFAQSAKRLVMPELPKNIFLDAIDQLVKIDEKWISSNPNASLYLRPFMFGNEGFLGVRPSQKYIFCIIASPVESFFTEMNESITVWIETEYSRTGPGGTGSAKCGSNYAVSFLAQKNALQSHCHQVLFLDMVERKWIEELGCMNICFVLANNTLITPSLKDTILAGITRNSVLKLAQQMGLTVEERPYAFESLKNDIQNKQLKEAFACGTAAIITPIGRFKYKGRELVVGDGLTGEITNKIRTELTNIQRGNIEDKNGWIRFVELS
ncbi:branched-chain amino acid aminotransferase [Bartonella ancashensis]|uniref:Probable branched-chain-amino-acid aminotransferase n=1 Tax=Bartonella ancashensis TaxID=1318743 RepID=A0A0M4L780_9HYPH|nr:branched-chain amino acid aminotransferase [Bartonella ancashensis]ALE03720.1 Branched-chain amino acid aminotransferase [Bartonella ancashensis]